MGRIVRPSTRNRSPYRPRQPRFGIKAGIPTTGACLTTHRRGAVRVKTGNGGGGESSMGAHSFAGMGALSFSAYNERNGESGHDSGGI